MLRIYCCLAAAFLALAVAHPAQASFVVNTDADEDIDSDGLCSLREALTAVNAQANYHDCVSLVPGESSVSFAIAPNAGELHTIALGGQLPAITRPITIDGSTQSGAQCSPLPQARVQITNPQQLAIDGLVLAAGSDTSVLAGLALSGFSAKLNTALYINSSNVAVGCLLAGTNAVGSLAQPNYYGIYVGPAGQSARIGIADGDGWDANLISGNSAANIFITSGGSGSVISGNYIGSDNSGQKALPSGYGIYVQGATDVHIGVASAAAAAALQRNVIAVASNGVNSSTNIELDTVMDAVVAGNYIGVGADGHTSVPIGSGSNVIVFQSSRSLIGCDGRSAWQDCRNVIANPAGPSILNFEGSTDTAIVNNFIGVAADGVTAFGGTVDVIGIDLIGADTLVARNRISAGSGIGIALNPNAANVTPLFLSQTMAGSSGATLDSSDNCVSGNGAGVYTNSLATPALTSFTENWWGAADGPAPAGSGDFSSANVTASPYLSAPSAYCGFDQVFAAGFE